jgi:phosphatidylserine/phosphatidylglycerophosphate/cardiolipin synthase-like enzyme
MRFPTAKTVFLTLSLMFSVSVLAAAEGLSDANYQNALDDLSASELTVNQDLKLYQNGDALRGFIKVAEGAQKYLFTAILSVTCDDSSEPLIVKYIEKAQAGVDVRLIVNKPYALLSRSCLRRLEAGGVKVVKAANHSSFILNDRDEMLIGSESIARMFFSADGFNGFDRDMMLYMRGPAATDALREFLVNWEDSGGAEQDNWAKIVVEKRLRESQEFRRGNYNYKKWLSTPSSGLCRFVAQRPKGELRGLERLWLKLTRDSRETIILSGVKIAYGKGVAKEIVQELKKKSQGGVQVDYIGNGQVAGNGELTMALNQIISTSGSVIGALLKWLRDWDADRKWRQHIEAYIRVLNRSQIRIWQYLNFIHYKTWNFDHMGIWIGSANLDDDAFSDFYESGVLCVDASLEKDFRQVLEVDMKNSTRYTGSNPKN